MPRPVRPLACPICGAALAGEGERHGDYAALRCPSGHTFDVAREGYVNLTAGRPPRHPGDTRKQLQARQAFLGGGHYRPVMEALAGAVNDHRTGPRVILDAGCGEGSYAAHLAMACAGAAVFGLDVSKEAAKLAARAHPGPRFVVADLTERLPLADASVDVLADVFAPRNPAEFARVLAADGLLIAAIPGPGHLAGVRTRFDLLGIEEDKEAAVVAQMAAAGLIHTASLPVEFPLALDGRALADLIMMTPSYYHLSAAQQAAVAVAEGMAAAAEVRLLIFRQSDD